MTTRTAIRRDWPSGGTRCRRRVALGLALLVCGAAACGRRSPSATTGPPSAGPVAMAAPYAAKPPEPAGAPPNPPRPEGAPCRKAAPLGETDIGCQCGIERFEARNLRTLLAVAGMRGDVVWLCMDDDKLTLTFGSEAPAPGSAVKEKSP